MTTTDRRDATDAQFAPALSVAERTRLNHIEDSAESTDACRWQVAIALYRHDTGATAPDEALRGYAEAYLGLADAVIDALKPAPGTDTSTEDALHRVLDLAEPGDPDARMGAYYYGFKRTGVGIVDGILSAVAQAGKSYHGTDMWSETDEWTPVSHADLIQAAADTAAARIRAAAADPQRDHDEEGGQ